MERGIPLPLGAVTGSPLRLDNLVELTPPYLAHSIGGNQTSLAADGKELSTAELPRDQDQGKTAAGADADAGRDYATARQRSRGAAGGRGIRSWISNERKRSRWWRSRGEPEAGRLAGVRERAK